MKQLSSYITEALYEPYILLASNGLRKASRGQAVLGKGKFLPHIPLEKITPADRTVYYLPKDLRKAKEAIGEMVCSAKGNQNVLVTTFKGKTLDAVYVGAVANASVPMTIYTIALLNTRRSGSLGPGHVYVTSSAGGRYAASTLLERGIDRVVVYDPKAISKLMDEGSKKDDQRKDSQKDATAMIDPAVQLFNNRRRYSTFVAFKNTGKFRDNIDGESKKPRQALSWVIDNLDGLLSCSNERETVETTNDVMDYICNFFDQARSVKTAGAGEFDDNSIALDQFAKRQKENKDLLPKVSRAMSSRPSGSHEPSYYLREYIPRTKKALKLLMNKFDWAVDQLCEQSAMGIFNYVNHLCDSAKSLIKLSYYLSREPDENWNDKYSNSGTAKMKLDNDLYVADQDIKSFL